MLKLYYIIIVDWSNDTKKPSRNSQAKHWKNSKTEVLFVFKIFQLDFLSSDHGNICTIILYLLWSNNLLKINRFMVPLISWWSCRFLIAGLDDRTYLVAGLAAFLDLILTWDRIQISVIELPLFVCRFYNTCILCTIESWVCDGVTTWLSYVRSFKNS